MGLIDRSLGLLFGGANVVRDTVEVFRENAESGAQRRADLSAGALSQFAAEFAPRPRGAFDRFMDGVNRLPRPALAMGTLGLFAAAMVDPIWFGQRMSGLALVPEPLWWLLGAIVSFYFGARHQEKGQQFQRSIATTLARTPVVAANIRALRAMEEDDDAPETDPAARRAEPPVTRSADLPVAPSAPASGAAAVAVSGPSANAALDDWRAGRG